MNTLMSKFTVKVIDENTIDGEKDSYVVLLFAMSWSNDASGSMIRMAKFSYDPNQENFTKPDHYSNARHKAETYAKYLYRTLTGDNHRHEDAVVYNISIENDDSVSLELMK